jgi:predicted nuclease of predicted toxin-antitoxin system
MKLVLDMHLSAEVAVELRSGGYDAFQLRERDLQHLTDEEIVALARAEDRVIVTFDLDFTTILARSRASGPSLALPYR